MQQSQNLSQTLPTPTITSKEARDKAIDLLGSDFVMFKEVYKDLPISFLKVFDPGTKWPKKLRHIFAEIWTGKSGPNVIMKAPRGGGKSKMLGSLGFCLFFFRDLKVIDMGGALAQAKVVYNYFTSIIFSNELIMNSLPKEPMLENTTGSHDNYFSNIY